MHARLQHAADKEFFDTHLTRNFLERLLGVADGKRHQNGARPGRNFVDIKPEPVGEKNDLGWNCRDCIVVVLPEEAEIDFGECINFGDSAEFEDLFAGALKHGMIGAIAGEFEAEVSLDRGADIRRSGFVDTPSAIIVLMANDPVGRLLKALGIAGAQQSVEQNVIGFEGSVGFEFAAPVAFVVERREKKLAGSANGGTDAGSETVDFAEAQLGSGI